ncbi:FAD-dependent monooxygenase [Aliirhizobium terrae]|uniref:FAD-dependent monooxygenase n=1 Tax=Terrirhizobium terrae TaxID=2926709 RepID=UPI002577A5F5|nr:FAD-dependent monooxygenase [Rhizobium sp. CC-CFT758]WJH40249.1 FAD-dependent monooxygenase [Rhizobium sp. CC-CFT758]
MHLDKVAIVGAGMAGLAAALSFSRLGIACDIFEEAEALVEVGAGLQMSPNASAILREFGVLNELERVWTEPREIALASGRSLRRLASVPAGEFARKRWGAPYGVLHRATLQQALLKAVEADPLCTVRLGTPVRGNPRHALYELTGISYPLVIGADGVWSNVRASVAKAPQPDFSGNIAWRFTLPLSEAPDWLPRDSVTALLGPSTHMVAYPLSEMGVINVVAIASGISPGETWDAEASESQRRILIQQFRAWSPEVTKLLSTTGQPTFWPLHQVTAGRWHNGSDIVLIGDAAHAMMPFAAQGAAMAIEDAFVLALEVQKATSLPAALSNFETVRAARAAKVRARGAFNRFAYHARGPLRIGRDIVLSMRPPQSLAADFDWLYGFRAG